MRGERKGRSMMIANVITQRPCRCLSRNVINGDCQLPLSRLRYRGARFTDGDSRVSPSLSYTRIYWYLHLRPILLRFPRGTRVRNSFPLGDRVLGLSRIVSALIYRPVRQRAVLENKELLDPQSYKSCREQRTSSSP